MDRRERTDDAVEATRAALDGRQAEMWTALPGIVQSFDPAAMTVTVQPAVQGSVTDETGKTESVNLPLLVDVPVVFPCGGGFTLTHPVRAGDEALVVFGSRCIDAWWQGGGVAAPPDGRMHDLSDGFAFVGPRSQAGKLVPPVDPVNVQLRTDDGMAHITMQPDYTIRMLNPTATVTMTPAGQIELAAMARISLAAPYITLSAASINVFSYTGGGGMSATIEGDITHLGSKSQVGDYAQQGRHVSTGDQVAGGVSQISHPHTGVEPGGGQTGPPVGGGA